MEILISSLGTAITVVSLFYAIKANREKEKLQSMIKAWAQGIAGNVDNIRRSPAWADEHLKSVSSAAVQLENNEHVEKIIKHAQLGARDAKATERMLSNLLNETLTLQRALFGTSEIIHPDKKAR